MIEFILSFLCRCTFIEVPKLTVPRISDNDPFVAVACGFAHTLALSSSGDLYGWGLNHNGQLGVGDNKARHAHTLIQSLTDISKIYASGNSSACLSANGNSTFQKYDTETSLTICIR